MDFSNSSRVPRWHPVEYPSGPLREPKSTENNILHHILHGSAQNLHLATRLDRFSHILTVDLILIVAEANLYKIIKYWWFKYARGYLKSKFKLVNCSLVQIQDGNGFINMKVLDFKHRPKSVTF